jgi:hypothetical protein
MVHWTPGCGPPTPPTRLWSAGKITSGPGNCRLPPPGARSIASPPVTLRVRLQGLDLVRQLRAAQAGPLGQRPVLLPLPLPDRVRPRQQDRRPPQRLPPRGRRPGPAGFLAGPSLHPTWPTPCTASLTPPPTTPARTPNSKPPAAAWPSATSASPATAPRWKPAPTGPDRPLDRRGHRPTRDGPDPTAPGHRPHPDDQQRGRHHRHRDGRPDRRPTTRRPRRQGRRLPAPRPQAHLQTASPHRPGPRTA